MRPFLLALVVLALAFAGCSTSSNPTPTTATTTTSTPATTTTINSTTPTATTPSTTTTPSSPTATTPTATTPAPSGLGADSYQLTTPDVPSMAPLAHAFNITLHVAGSPQFSSNHIGAHYASSPQSAPDATNMQACDHQSGNLPGDFVVSCNITTPGTWYLYGHARVTENNVTHDYWGPQATLVVVNATVVVTPPTVTPIAGQAASFKVAVSGDAGTGVLINATYGGNSSTTPSFAAYPSGCQSTQHDAPYNATIVCTFASSGTYYLRGYARYGDATSQAVIWSDEVKVIVTGVSGGIIPGVG